jgi:hypothetical protein
MWRVAVEAAGDSNLGGRYPSLAVVRDAHSYSEDIRVLGECLTGQGRDVGLATLDRLLDWGGCAGAGRHLEVPEPLVPILPVRSLRLRPGSAEPDANGRAWSALRRQTREEVSICAESAPIPIKAMVVHIWGIYAARERR